MRRVLRRFTKPALSTLLVAALAAACGGGGGGGGGGSTGGTGVRVLHASVDSVPVDVLSSSASAAVVSQAKFAIASGYSSLSSGAQVLSMTKAFNPGQVVDSFSVDYASGERYSMLLYGDHGAFGVRTALIKDAVPADISGSVVRVVDGVTGASALAVSVNGVSAGTVGFGEAGDYIAVPAGQVTVSAVRASDGRVAASSVITAQQGKAYTLLVAGEIGYYSKGVLFTDN